MATQNQSIVAEALGALGFESVPQMIDGKPVMCGEQEFKPTEKTAQILKEHKSFNVTGEGKVKPR